MIAKGVLSKALVEKFQCGEPISTREHHKIPLIKPDGSFIPQIEVEYTATLSSSLGTRLAVKLVSFGNLAPQPFVDVEDVKVAV